ncbi:MAG: hypothetical protein ACR2O1_05495 [Boseongicola sp.]
MRTLILLSLMALTACGADGSPEPVEPGVEVTGQVKIGLTGTN